MELPKNGGVIIIDDQIDEVIPLMNALSLKGVAYSYYDGNVTNYPSEPLTNIRLVFLDMHLDKVAASSNNTKSIISTLISGLEAIIDKNNGPYAILVWSKHDSQHFDAFKREVMENGALPCVPIEVLNLEKSKCFDRSDEENGRWRIKPDGLKIIEKSLEEQLTVVDGFTVLCGWENAIRDATGKTLMSFSNVFDEDSTTWNTNLKSCFYRVARAYAGNNLILNDKNILENAFYALNMIANDFNCIEVKQKSESLQKVDILQKDSDNNIILLEIRCDGKQYYVIFENNEKKYKIFDVEEKRYGKGQNDLSKLLRSQENSPEYKKILQSINERIVGCVNTFLNIRKYLLDQYRPGNVYNSSDEMTEEIINSYVKTTKFYEKIVNNREEVRGIELEISPLCDFAQDKRQRLRILPGLMVPSTLDVSELKKAKYVYVSSVLNVDGKCVKMIFDFRFFKSEDMDYLKGKVEPIFALRDEILQTIVDQFAMHASRSGFVYME